MTRWPWITLVLAAIAIFNPVGWDVIGAAIRYSVTDWLRDLWVAVALGSAASLAALGVVEWYVRRLLVARRARMTTDAELQDG